MKDVVYMSAEAWNEVKSSTLHKSWRKLLNVTENPETVSKDIENDEDLVGLAQRIPADEPINEDDVADWINADEEFEVTDDMIIEAVNVDARNEESDDSDSEGIEVEVNKISHSEGCKAIEKAIEYFEQQSETTATDLLLLRRLRERAAKNRATSVKQKTLKDFFKKKKLHILNYFFSFSLHKYILY